MVSFKNGTIKVTYENGRGAKLFFEICFVLNIVTIFAYYQVKLVASFTGLFMLIAALFIWISQKNSKVIIPYNAVWYTAIIVYGCLSELWAPYIPSGFLGFLMKLLVVLAMTTSIAIYVSGPEDLERLMSLFCLSMVIIVLLELSAIPMSSLFAGSFGSNFSYFNPNEIGFWAVCAEMMAFYFAYIKEKKGYYILVLLFLMFAVLTSSRKDTAAVIVAPLIMMLLTTHKKYKFIQVLLMIGVVAGLIYFIMNNEQLYNAVGRRFNSMSYYYSDKTVKTDYSLQIRNYYIEVAKEIFARNPIFGNGMANYGEILNREYGVLKAYSHNNYWQILSELGVIGFVIYYSLYFVIIVKLAKNMIVNKSRIAILFLTFMVLLLILEWGMVAIYTKTAQIIIAIAYAASYVSEDDGRRYKYIENNANKMEV